MQLETIGFKGGIDAAISGGFGGLTGVASSMAAVLTPLLSKTYDYIQVDFDEDGCVVKVIFEKSRCDAIDKKSRKVDKMLFSDDEAKYGIARTEKLYYYEDFSGDEKSATIVTKDRQAWYTTYFDGGSFIRSYVESFSFNQFVYGKEKVECTWKDDYAEYSTEQWATRLGYVDSGGAWVNEDKVFVDINYLPDSVKKIGDDAYKNSYINSITIPDDVNVIGNRAFSGCRELSKIVIGKRVQSIGEYAFSNCAGLKYIDIPSSVSDIGANAFKGCELYAIHCAANTIPNGWNADWNSDNYAVYTRCSKVNGINYSLSYNSSYQLEAVVTVQDSDFENAIIPSTVDFGGFLSIYNVAEIAPYAFAGCSKLTNITISNNVKIIGNNAFFGCAKLENIDILDSIEQVGKNVFANCKTLKYNEYGNGLYLGNKNNKCVLFVEMKNKEATSCALNSNTVLIFGGALEGCDKLESVVIPANVINLPENLFDSCKNLSSIIVDEDNAMYSSQSGILYNKAKTVFIHIPQAVGGSVKIPYGITSIEERAFSGRENIIDIDIPYSVTSIGNRAFSVCSRLKSVTIPDSVTSIEDYTFYGCGDLMSITIPKSVMSIGDYAFYNCRDLTNIKFNGTKDEWNKISKGDRWNHFSGDYIVSCTDGNLSKS